MSNMFPYIHRRKIRRTGDLACIFVHAGAGYHSLANEATHLQACNDASKAGLALLRGGGSSVDAVEIAIKVLEDREITNAGYGSNMAMDGTVECDAVIVDHNGRSGGVGAVAQIKNPISLARLILDHTNRPLSLRRVPPNLLVGQGATDFAYDNGMPVLPHDALVSAGAHERWARWNKDLRQAEKKGQVDSPEDDNESMSSEPELGSSYEAKVQSAMRRAHTKTMQDCVWNEAQPISPPPSELSPIDSSPSPGSGLHALDRSVGTDLFGPPGMMTGILRRETTVGADASSVTDGCDNSFKLSPAASEAINDEGTGSADLTMVNIDNVMQASERLQWHDGSSHSDTATSSTASLQLPSLTPSPPDLSMDGLQPVLLEIENTPVEPLAPQRTLHQLPSRLQVDQEDAITDTVGVIAIDSYGNIACGASSGGIGMKHRGRIGPAALVGVGAAVIPKDPEDKTKTSVAVVTSGTGEHMTTTMAANLFAERMYTGTKKVPGHGYATADDYDDVIRSVIEKEFMGHPSVKNSTSTGAIGVLCVMKSQEGIYLYFAHNTDSFAVASASADDPVPACSMSRSQGGGVIAQGGRAIRQRKRRPAQDT